MAYIQDVLPPTPSALPLPVTPRARPRSKPPGRCGGRARPLEGDARADGFGGAGRCFGCAGPHRPPRPRPASWAGSRLGHGQIWAGRHAPSPVPPTFHAHTPSTHTLIGTGRVSFGSYVTPGWSIGLILAIVPCDKSAAARHRPLIWAGCRQPHAQP